MLDFTAIDFETANSKRASVCAVGATRVRDGRIVDASTNSSTRPLDTTNSTNGTFGSTTSTQKMLHNRPHGPRLHPV